MAFINRAEKRKVIEISRSEMGCCIIAYPDDETQLDNMKEECKQLLDEASEGDSVTFTVKEMTQDEIDALPEFEGW